MVVRNKKGGIALGEMVGLIVVIAMLVSMAVVLSKCTSGFTKQEGETSFLALHKEINSKNTIGNRLLIMDEGQAIVYFEPNKKEVVVNVDGDLSRNYEVFFKRPFSCPEEDKACLCLLRENEYEKRDGDDRYFAYSVDSKKPICRQDLKDEISLKQCGFGKVLGVQSYTCKNGFVIERNVMKDVRDTLNLIATKDTHYELSKRVQVNIARSFNKVELTLE
jgi:hypothetical protein